MSFLIAGSTKVKIALTISKQTRERINEIMARPDHPTLTDVVNELLIAGLDASDGLALTYPTQEELDEYKLDHSPYSGCCAAHCGRQRTSNRAESPQPN